MSRVVENIVVVFSFIAILINSGCNVFDKKDMMLAEKSSNVSRGDVSKTEERTLYDLKERSTDATSEKIINQMPYHDPSYVVDDLLRTPNKNLNIAIVAPVTGAYSSIGMAAVESVLLTISRSKYNSTGTINVYDIGKIVDNNWKENKEVKRLIADNNDVIIGSFFNDTTEKLLSLIPEDKLFISITNNGKFAEKYPNLVVLSMDDRFKINSLFQYLKNMRRRFLSLVLPATKKGYALEKLFRKIAEDNNITIIHSQFYQAKSRVSILAAARGVNKSFTATYVVDENGRFKTEKYKDNLAKKQNKDLSTGVEKIIKKAKTEAIYIDAAEDDLLSILNAFDDLGILRKNVHIFSNAIFNTSDSTLLKFSDINYIGYNYNFVNYFNDKFKNYFKHEPNYVAYVVYDAMSMLHYIANEGKMLPRKFYDEDGFRGVLDEFRFSRDGSVERRFGIYKLRNNNMLRVFVPDDYFSLNQGDSRYFNKKTVQKTS